MSRRHEIAKFIAGFTFHEAFSHTLLSGSGLLPFSVFGITVTAGYNAAIILMWWLVTGALVYYAWFFKK